MKYYSCSLKCFYVSLLVMCGFQWTQNTLFGQIYLHGPTSGSVSLKMNLLAMPSDLFLNSLYQPEKNVTWIFDFGYHRPFQQQYLDIRHVLIQFRKRKSSFAIGLIQSGDQLLKEHLTQLSYNRKLGVGIVGLGLSSYKLLVQSYPTATLYSLQPSFLFWLNAELQTYLITQFFLYSDKLFDPRIDQQTQTLTYGLSYCLNKHLKGAIEATTTTNSSLDFRSQIVFKPSRLPLHVSLAYGFLRQQALFGLFIQQKKLSVRINYSTHPHLPISQQYTFAIQR